MTYVCTANDTKNSLLSTEKGIDTINGSCDDYPKSKLNCEKVLYIGTTEKQICPNLVPNQTPPDPCFHPFLIMAIYLTAHSLILYAHQKSDKVSQHHRGHCAPRLPARPRPRPSPPLCPTSPFSTEVLLR